MRTTLSLLCLFALLVLTTPAQAQLRADAQPPAPVAVYETGGSDASGEGLGAQLTDWVGKAFSDEHFRMSHSYSMSMSSFGGGTSLGMYTNTMQWQFNDKWAARVDVSMAHQPFSGGGFQQGGQNMKFFLRNAEVAYRPNENMTFHFQIRQSPYGRYARPYGRARPGFGPAGRRALAPPPLQRRGGLFWKSSQRN